MTADRPKVGISACLLGDEVRYDGGHKLDAALIETVGRLVEWVPVCPEVECGLGTPREPMRLVGVGRNVRVITIDTATDLTERVATYACRRVEALVDDELSGYVFKNNSPSCGVEGVKVYDARGVATASGRGVFAAAVMERMPRLPVEEAERLSDVTRRENFLERVFAYWRRSS